MAGVSEESCRELALWRAVVHQALVDLTDNETRHDDYYWRRNAYAFIFNQPRTLSTICDIADLNPDCIRREALRRLEGMGGGSRKRAGNRKKKSEMKN